MIIGVIIWGIIWGFATNKVIENKGYEENWFWWGFFFGFIALIVACTKPVVPQEIYTPPTYSEGSNGRASLSSALSSPTSSSWTCKRCGRTNYSYEYTCKCGMTKSNNFNTNLSAKSAPVSQEIINEESKDTEKENLDKLKAYKELLDMGAITEEEFKEHKERLLNNKPEEIPVQNEVKPIITDDKVYPVIVERASERKTHWKCDKCGKENNISRKTCFHCGEAKSRWSK